MEENNNEKTEEFLDDRKYFINEEAFQEYTKKMILEQYSIKKEDLEKYQLAAFFSETVRKKVPFSKNKEVVENQRMKELCLQLSDINKKFENELHFMNSFSVRYKKLMEASMQITEAMFKIQDSCEYVYVYADNELPKLQYRKPWW